MTQLTAFCPGIGLMLQPPMMAVKLSAGTDLERQALEAPVFRTGRLTKGELADALGFAGLNEIDGFLKARGVFELKRIRA